LSLRDILLAIGVCIIWGGNFTAAKIATYSLPPLFTMSLRMMLVSLFLIPYYRPINVKFRDLVILAFNNSVGHHGLLYCAVGRGLSVSATVLTVQLNVPITILLSWYFFKSKITFPQIIGMITAFVGITLIVGSPQVLGNIKALIMAFGGAIFFALFNIHIKKIGDYDIYGFLAWTSLIATIILSILSLLIEPISLESFRSIDLKASLSICYMSASSIIGFGIWCYLIQNNLITLIAPFSLLIPVFGILSAIIFIDEELSSQMLGGAICTICGIALMIINFGKIITWSKS
jgi:O-acetylserine/cysteine efflux transporter